MTDNDYLLPGIATLLLAVAFPVFWLWGIATPGFDYSFDDGRQGYAIGGPAFLALGILSAYVYWAFRRQLHEHYDFRGAHTALALLIGWNLLFAVYVTTVDVLAPVYGDAYDELSLTLAWVGLSVGFGVLDIILAVLLLRARHQLPDLVTMFAIANLILGIFEVTIVFSFAVIFLFPIALLMIGLNFLKKPEMIEIV